MNPTFSTFLTSLIITISSALIAQSNPITLGNPSTTDASGDGWISNMVINETDTYTNTSGAEVVTINKFNFYAKQLGDPVTPFLVKVNGDNDFIVLKIGTTRTAGEYIVGANSFGFDANGNPTILLNTNETIAIGFLDASADGLDSGISSVIPFDEAAPEDEIWYTGNSGTGSGSVVEGQAPNQGAGLITTLTRNYHFNFELDINPFSTFDLYVSPNGNDANAGTQSAPFATLERARDEVRSQNGGATTVWLMDGDYYLNNSFELSSQDGGTAAERITYKAVNKNGAVLHLNKAVPVSDFTPVTDPAMLNRIDPVATGQIMELDLAALGVQNMNTWPDYFPAANQELFRLYTDFNELPLSRYPNDSMMTMETVLQNEPGIFKYRGDRHKRWMHAVSDGLWFQGYWRVAWQFDAVRTASLDTVNRIATQVTSVPGGIGDKYTRPAGNGMEPYFATNLIEEIDYPGEWSVNFTNNKLYIWIPSGITEIKILDNKNPLVKMTNVSYVDFVGIKFDYGLGSAVEISDGFDNKIIGCDISNFIEDAIRILNGHDHDVISCDLHDLGAGGVYLSGGDRYTLDEAGHTVVNNHIYEFGRVKVIYAGAVEVPGKYVNNNVGMYVAHNRIHGTPHVGVLFGGNNNVFEYNEIFDICRVSNDMGGFYTWNDWTSYGNVFRYNYVHDAHQAHGVYMDDGDSGDDIYNNVFQNIDVGVFIGGGHDINAYNNLSIGCEKTVHIDNRGVSRGYNLDNTGMVNRVLSVDYQNPPWSTQYPTIVGILDSTYAQELPTNCSINCNVGINTPIVVDIDASTATNWGVNLGQNYSDTDASLTNSTLSTIAAATGYNGASCIGNIPYTEIGLFDDECREVCIENTDYDIYDNTIYASSDHRLIASNILQADGSVVPPAYLNYQAATCIELLNDFEVELGAGFLAEIRENCDHTSNLQPNPPASQNKKVSGPKPTKRILQSNKKAITSGGSEIEFDLMISQKISIIISDEKGKTIKYLLKNVQKERGKHFVQLKMKDVNPGKYYYTIDGDDGGETVQFEVK